MTVRYGNTLVRKALTASVLVLFVCCLARPSSGQPLYIGRQAGPTTGTIGQNVIQMQFPSDADRPAAPTREAMEKAGFHAKSANQFVKEGITVAEAKSALGFKAAELSPVINGPNVDPWVEVNFKGAYCELKSRPGTPNPRLDDEALVDVTVYLVPPTTAKRTPTPLADDGKPGSVGRVFLQANGFDERKPGIFFSRDLVQMSQLRSLLGVEWKEMKPLPDAPKAIPAYWTEIAGAKCTLRMPVDCCRADDPDPRGYVTIDTNTQPTLSADTTTGTLPVAIEKPESGK